MPRETRSFEEDVARSVEDWLHKYIPAVADRLGPLPNSVQPTQKELAERWNLRSPQVQPGQEAELARQALSVITEEHAQQGKPLPDPETMVKLVAARTSAALYPYREKVYGTGNPRPEERVKAARRFARRAQKRVEPVETMGLPSGGLEPPTSPSGPLPIELQGQPVADDTAMSAGAPTPTPEPQEGGY